MLNRFFRRVANKSKKLQPKSPSSKSPVDIALRLLACRTDPVTIVQIGACDGLANDPLYSHLTVKNFTAFLVEPLPHNFYALSKLHEGKDHVTCIQAAVGESNGHTRIFCVGPDCPYEGNQLASFDREHLIRNGVKSKHVIAVDVQMITILDLCTRHQISQIDFLQVDTEGFDGAIVRFALELSPQPNFINFEHIHLPRHEQSALHQMLDLADYDFVVADTDTFAWKKL